MFDQTQIGLIRGRDVINGVLFVVDVKIDKLIHIDHLVYIYFSLSSDIFSPLLQNWSL